MIFLQAGHMTKELAKNVLMRFSNIKFENDDTLNKFKEEKYYISDAICKLII